MFPSSLSTAAVVLPAKRNVKDVPFVELMDGRLQGVASSGSDIQRVYVAYFEAKTMNFYCSTNNNRPCGGISSKTICKHLQKLLIEAVKQYGLEGTTQFLQVDPTTIKKDTDLFRHVGSMIRTPAGDVFSRFLGYLQLVEIPDSGLPLPEMDWFSTGG